MPAATTTQEAQLAQAVIAKATRLYVLVEAPLGVVGEMSELGMVTVRPDYTIGELLFGLRYQDITVEDWTSIVTASDVIRSGLNMDPATAPDYVEAGVERALTAAIGWVETELAGGAGAG